ncbi:MAG: BrnA antitoxin family protein [Candidatus Tectomicrobia bacterium]|nr:BrnA antitoxin family protein [Candidatus Tectomicrobia bacterium]
MPKKPLKPIPHFESEAEEREFWETHDSTDYIDWSEARPIRLPNLKPSTRELSLQLPLSLFEDLKIEANWRHVPLDALVKLWLEDKLEEQQAKRRPRRTKKKEKRDELGMT